MKKTVVVIIGLLIAAGVAIGITYGLTHKTLKEKTIIPKVYSDVCGDTDAGFQCACGKYKDRDNNCKKGLKYCNSQSDCSDIKDSKCVNSTCTPGNVCLPIGSSCGAASYCCDGSYCAIFQQEMFQGKNAFSPLGTCVKVGSDACQSSADCPQGQVCAHASREYVSQEGDPTGYGSFACVDPKSIICQDPFDCLRMGPLDPLKCNRDGRCELAIGECKGCQQYCDEQNKCCTGLVCIGNLCKNTTGNRQGNLLCKDYLDDAVWIINEGENGYCEKEEDCIKNGFTACLDEECTAEGNGTPIIPSSIRQQCDPLVNACIYGCTEKGNCRTDSVCLGGICYPRF